METRFSPALSGALAMVVCGFLWSLAGLFIKVLNWNPFLIAGLRSLIAFLFLLALVGTVRLQWSKALFGAALANAATMLLFVAANKSTTAANAILLQYLAPVFTAAFSVLFLKERLYREQVLALLMTIVGMVVLFLDRLSPGQLAGNLMALTSAFTFSLMFIFTRMQKDGDPLHSFMASHAVAAVVALGAAAFLPLPVFTGTALASILALGVVQIGLASLFFSYGIKRVSAVTANLIAVIEPVFNPVWVFLVLGETPSANTIAGGALILGSVTAASLISARRIPKYA
ncbi:DMT family transporter [Geomonas anaerohicana]|uniref:EamA family transporter n=1 Tax=Geomonas anaerohicana TaxID=2798583 RepID=A0ABS0YHT7_9BACT|nr:DMT family transporter [Geomonas anaerohicana]MBJ6751846.1 EamA family transporter [Geomonas anaerohicana]